MNNTIVFESTTKQTIDSREVAEMVGKQHNELLKDIRRYSEQLREGKIPHTDFFTESTYLTGQNKEMPCYLVTRKGCEFIANKLTGVKGTEFTAKYINRFHDMEKSLNSFEKQIPRTYKEALIQLVEQVEQNERIQKEAQSLSLENKKKDQLIGELKPKADYTDRILQSNVLVNTNQIAKDYGMSAKSFNKELHYLGVQYNQGGQWLLYSKYQNKGYTSSETFEIEHKNGAKSVTMRTKWTQKGRLFIYELLKRNGILPLIEKDMAS